MKKGTAYGIAMRTMFIRIPIQKPLNKRDVIVPIVDDNEKPIGSLVLKSDLVEQMSAFTNKIRLLLIMGAVVVFGVDAGERSGERGVAGRGQRGCGKAVALPARAVVRRTIAAIDTLPLSRMAESAASSKVSVALLAKVKVLAALASDSTTRFSPLGATAIASTSLRMPWVRLWKVTVALVTRPVIPLTVMDDG